jgi:hypothetical protein
MWVKDRGDIPVGFTIIKWRTKRPDARIYGATTINETRWYSREEDIGGIQRKVGSRQTPGKTFGRVCEWILNRARSEPDGKKHRVVKEYLGADEWDKDMYLE